MSKRQAVYYGQVQLIPGIICDGYVLDDETAVMSERGTADLLGMDVAALSRVLTKSVPKNIKSFIDKDLSALTDLVEVIASNSPHRGRNILICSAETIETLIFAYSLALGYNKLRQNQRHVGTRCIILLKALVRTALETAIKEACGFFPEIQKTAQKHYTNAVDLLQQMGFTCSIDDGENRIATKKDITDFLNIPQSTLNNFLRKHKDDITHIRLDCATIFSLGHKARRMNGYSLDDVAKIACGIDTQPGIELKKRLFGQVGVFADPYTKPEIQWRKTLSKVFNGLGLQFNFTIGPYQADYFVKLLDLVLECNGYDCHRGYDPVAEKEREKFIAKRYALVRFHHKVSLETLFNGILQAKPGKIIKLYDLCE